MIIKYEKRGWERKIIKELWIFLHMKVDDKSQNKRHRHERTETSSSNQVAVSL